MEYVVGIVAIVMAAGVLNNYIGKRGSGLNMDELYDELGMGTMDQNEKRIADLEERVKVLERIATDRGANLADEIEKL